LTADRYCRRSRRTWAGGAATPLTLFSASHHVFCPEHLPHGVVGFSAARPTVSHLRDQKGTSPGRHWTCAELTPRSPGSGRSVDVLWWSRDVRTHRGSRPAHPAALCH